MSTDGNDGIAFHDLVIAPAGESFKRSAQDLALLAHRPKALTSRLGTMTALFQTLVY